jgi:branched-chain amino acid transport system permease protein
MTGARRDSAVYSAILVASLAAPFLFPAYQAQLAFLWVMVLFALTWDLQGGQMGYNSFGNIVFFGIGMYVCAAVQVGLYHDLAAYTAPGGGQVFRFTEREFLIGLALGMVASGLAAVAVAATLGAAILGLRGHYFAIGTLGLGIAAGQIAGGIPIIGAGQGMVPPLFPDSLGSRERFFYYVFFALVVVAFATLKWLYRGRFGLVLNAIRDDEDKAEAMGLYTTRYKTLAWCVSAFFLGLSGGGVGILIGFIDPTDTAFAAGSFGVWMVLMAILGGKGTVWGPVIGAVVFHVFRELFWTYLLGWQRVALGLLIVVIVVFFPNGILGWMRERWPARFGRRVEPATDEGAP